MKRRKLWTEIIAYLKLIAADNRKVVCILVLGAVAKAAAPFLSLYFSARILNEMLAGRYDACAKSAAVMLLLRLALGMIEKACDRAVDAQQEGCARSIKQRMAKKAYELEYEAFEKQETLEAIQRAKVAFVGVGGVETQMTFLYQIFAEAISIVFSAAFVVILLLQVGEGETNFFTSYGATVVLLLIYALILWMNKKISTKSYETYAKMQERNYHVNAEMGYFSDVICDEKNAKDLRVFQMQDILLEKHEDLSKKGLSVYLGTGKKVGKYHGAGGFLNQIAAGLSYVFVGAKAIYGAIGIGDVLLYAGAINQLFEMLVRIGRSIFEYSYRADIMKTFENFINRPSMSYDGTLPIEKRDDARYEFEFHDVSFSYPGAEEDAAKEVLKHVNLKFNIGEKLALVGKNGAGKTTLIKLLCRLYEPTEGYITLNGIDIRKYNYKEYTKAFSVVFQDFNIFSLPLDENVASGSEVDEERVWKVLEEVALKERVAQMAHGIHTKLYNNNGTGIDISGGEAQRLAIARALYKDAPFVILDEPTAALDPIAEAEIYENFNRMVADKTAIYISHRMSSCKFCDRIVVLEQGEIKEAGTHEELIRQQGIYNELYETQAQYYCDTTITSYNENYA